MTPLALLDVISAVFDRVLECSLQAGLVIVIVLAIRAAVGRQLTGRWLHALWLIVLLRLALPWVPATHWNPVGRLSAIDWRGSAAPPTTTVLPMPDQADTDPPTLSPNLLSFAPSPSPVEPAASQHQPATVAAWTPRHVVCLVWISGAAVLGAFICWNMVRLRRAIVRERLLTDASILNLLEDCKRQMGIVVPVGIVITEKTGSPALFGFLRPRLLMPPGVLENLKHEELRHVFLHELAHLRRHDVLVSWIMCVLQLLHWCNPLVWLAQNRMRADRELACDALVLKVLRGQEPQQYGNTIVRLLEHFSRPRYIPALTGILEETSQLKRRVTMIAEFKPQSRKSTILGIGLLGTVAVLALTTAPGVAAPDASKPSAAGSGTHAPSSRPVIYSQDKLYTIIPGKGLDLLPVGATAHQVKAVFGEPDGKDDFNRAYKLSYSKADVEFIVGKESDQVNEIHFNEGFHGRLANGVRMRSTLDVLLSTLGQPKKKVNASPEEAQSLHMGSDHVLYTQRMGRDIVSYQLADEKQGANYWFDKDKKLIQVVVYRPRGLDPNEITPADLPEGSRIDERGHIVDRTDWPFVNDPAALGKWESVDFVRSMDQFNPGKQSWQGELFFKGLVISEGGKTNFGFLTWTKSLLIHLGDKTASRYVIKGVDGTSYMFMEWKSGDYTIRRQRPFYYVLKKPPALDATKSNAAAEKAAIESAQPWLELVDAGKYAKSWEEAAGPLKSVANQEDLEKSLRAARTPLGKLISRKVKSQQYAKALPGAPDGEYVVIQYQTKFEHKADAIETVTPMLDKDGKWRVSGYYVK